MKFGYARVSTREQNEARQIEALREYGIDERNIYVDKISGVASNRPALQELMDYLREDDTLVVLSFDRLARSTKQLLEISEKLAENGVNLISVKEKIDTSTPQGKLFFTISSAFAEFEREMIKERQREGYEVAKKAGRKFGRKPMDESKVRIALDLHNTGKYTVKKACEMACISESVFYRAKRKGL